MSGKEYVWMFTRLPTYAPFIVADPKLRMSKFVLGVSDLVVKEYRTTMLGHDINISRLMIYAQRIEKEKLRERSKETKRYRIDDDNSSNKRFDGHGRPRFQQRFSEQDPSRIPPRFSKGRVSNQKSQGKDRRPIFFTCSSCGKS